MFYGREFTFDGVSSRMYGLEIYNLDNDGQSDVAYGNRASIIETHTISRRRNIHYGVDYSSQAFEFNIVFGSSKPLDRITMSEISLWLTGHQDYRWFEIIQSDMIDVAYKVIITELTPVTIHSIPYAFRATIHCDSPYAYGPKWTKSLSTDGESQSLYIYNQGATWEYLYPSIYYKATSGLASLSIINQEDNNREFKLENISSGAIVEIDNENGIIKNTGTGATNLYTGFNYNFFRLVHGDNHLTVKGTAGILKISGRFMYNMGA